MVNDEHLHKAFALFDQNHNGYIEFEELRHALSDEEDINGIEDVINAILQDVDTYKVSSFGCHFVPYYQQTYCYPLFWEISVFKQKIS